jgi:predicted dehydrogenase
MYDRAAGGGYLAGMLAHDLDLICSLLGPPVEVCADVRTSIPVRELADGEHLEVTADDTSAVLLRMASGALAVLSITVMGAHADAYGLELYGTDGTIVGNGSLRSTEYRAGRPGDEALALMAPSDRLPIGDAQLPGGLAGQAIRSMALMLEDWLPAFDGAPTPVPTLQDGRLVVAITEAAHRSAEGAGWVRVDRGDRAP